MRVHTFPKDINPKVNLITCLEFKIAYYDVPDQHVNHYVTEIHDVAVEHVSHYTIGTPSHLLLACHRSACNPLYLGKPPIYNRYSNINFIKLW